MASTLICSETLVDDKPDCCSYNVLSFEREEKFGCVRSNEHTSIYLPNPSYAFTIQKQEGFVKYREEAYRWMIKICTSRGSSMDVVYSGMNYFDRYLSKKVIRQANAELLLWCCLYLASAQFDNRTTYISNMELLLTVKGTYSKYKVRSMIDDILLVLDFHLLPQSPYSEGCKWLTDTGYSSLLPSYQSLLNGICSSYKSIGISYNSIARVGVLLIWYFCFPDKCIPSSLSKCEQVYSADSDCIISIVKELFPMKRDCCDFVTRLLHKKENSNSSPTSASTILRVCHKQVHLT